MSDDDYNESDADHRLNPDLPAGPISMSEWVRRFWKPRAAARDDLIPYPPKHLCPDCKSPRIAAPKQRDGWTCKCRGYRTLMQASCKHRFRNEDGSCKDCGKEWSE